MFGRQINARSQQNLGQSLDLNVAGDHEHWPRPEDIEWTVLLYPWVGLLTECRLHAYCFKDLLLHTIVKLSEIRVFLFLAEVYCPNFSPF